MGEDLEQLAGTVERTVFHNPETRWTVLRVHMPGEPALQTFVGRSPGVEDGAEIRVHGRWTSHPSHGRQFAWEHLAITQPSTEPQIVNRLKTYPGIKDKMAEKIVRRFGTDTLTILDREPNRLLEVEGFGKKTLARVKHHHEEHRGPIADLENRLIDLAISPRLAKLVHRRYGEQAMAMLEQHPYKLAREVHGIGFTTADRIARALGVDLDSDERVDAGIVHAFEKAESDGHCALPLPVAREQARKLLTLPADRIERGIDRLIEDGDLIPRICPPLIEAAEAGAVERELLFTREHDQAEDNLVHALLAIACAPHPAWAVGELPDHLSDGQRRAVEAVCRSGVVILTGGPGTGKSTVVANVIAVAKREEVPLLLAAPTGRAAKRIEQATGESAKTVHRLLIFDPESNAFVHCANNPLQPGLVVVDESSMLDLELAEALLTSLTTQHRLLLVGDADQLPSVGPGNVLRDLIRAAEQGESPIPVVRLDTIFRQQEGSTIVSNAHRVLHGQSLAPDEPARGKQGEFFVLRARDAERTHEVIVELAAQRIPEAYGFDRFGEIQVLCPMHKGAAGTEAFNATLQARYTGEHEGIEGLAPPGGGRARAFHVGDRVMQIRNDYERSVFNGDIGIVSRIHAGDGYLSVDFDGAVARYERKDLGDLRLAYAISIHKSQGSEFPAVIIPMLLEHHVMLRRNLLYTAITRAKRLCMLVGDTRAIERAIRRADAARRWTGLAERTVALLDARLGRTQVVAIE
ncbi:ATP-dependent RecD-like DNA helicase [Nannocystaceae bacterium ST9]